MQDHSNFASFEGSADRNAEDRTSDSSSEDSASFSGDQIGYMPLLGNMSDDDDDDSDGDHFQVPGNGFREDDEGQNTENLVQAAMQIIEADYTYTVNAKSMAELEAEMGFIVKGETALSTNEPIQTDDGHDEPFLPNSDAGIAQNSDQDNKSINGPLVDEALSNNTFASEPMDADVAEKIKQLTLGFNLRLNRMPK
mmetsp:Transcript_13796/g.26772  ORF Transcript_13796/g.26772 Transcript_13796/m.26772 type:complete len:196 (+) Transcript_13796:170-757(+)|eukprot:CAMPEP_0171490450 /NCGR_PEP_ID=MMETSP0958-20121227/3310_1 /TAXON_ID=87120 /ORGANISM="Aurantiochytrium limacinum, Strain ATCCMYA-1381" /LENGTH=195 /DNA_ID=CAMNT_0012023757 /DNA_START=57 /DNA_END=644 /DNA_ORIENTATION=+